MTKVKGIIISIIIITIGIFIPLMAFAAPVGNPAISDTPRPPGVFSLKQDKDVTIKVSGTVEFLFNKDMSANVGTHTKFDSCQWYTAKIAYGLFNDKIEPYIELSSTKLQAKWNEPGGQQVKVESDLGFTWGLGLKAQLFNLDRPKVKFTGDMLYRFTDLDLNSKGYAGNQEIVVDNGMSRCTLREWQVAIIASTEVDVSGSERADMLGISRLVPYAGLKYSDATGRLRASQSTGSFYNPGVIKANRNFGILAGCDILGPNSVLVNIEGRFMDETALSAGLAVLF